MPLQLRNQFLLDLSKPEVENFMLDMLNGLLVRYDISYLKWDMNRIRADVDEQKHPMNREKHVFAVYSILEQLQLAFPQVGIEACSGGDSRVDLGMLARTDEFWPSDNTDPYERLFIQEGYSLCYAPVLTNYWVTNTPATAHQVGRDTLAYKFHVAMCGPLGAGANISRFTSEQLGSTVGRLPPTKKFALWFRSAISIAGYLNRKARAQRWSAL